MSYNVPQGSDSSQWLWSQSLQQYYYQTFENGQNVIVLRDGTRRAVPSAPNPNNPRTVNVPQSIPSGSGLNASAARYGQSPPRQDYTADSSYGIQQVAAQMAQVNIASGSGAQTRTQNNVQPRIGTGPRGEKILYGTSGEQEVLDPSYKKRPDARHFFKVGKVFYVLWTEPSEDNNTFVTPVRLGGGAYTKIRRFVVIREGGNYCTAVPITTYGGRGLKKVGTNPAEHAIIYTGRQPPPQTSADQGILPIQIQVDPSEPDEVLDPRSRLNLGKVYTIEHNLKVKPAGMVRNIDDLLRAVSRVRGYSSSIAGREAPPELNVPIASIPRGGQRPSGDTRATAGSSAQGQGSQTPAAMASRLQAALQANQITPAQFQAGMVRLGQTESQAAQRARAIMQARQQQLEDDEDEDDEDDDEDDDSDDEPAPRRQYGQPQPRSG